MGQADFGRIRRRHHDGANLVGPQRVDGNGQHQCRVDAAGQAEERAGEAIFPQIIAYAQHERLVDLRFKRLLRGNLALA